MSEIRPLARDDLPAVAALYERTMRSGGAVPPPLLAAAFERCFLRQPWADPEVPSLVFTGRAGDIVGFIGSSVRRLVFDGRPIRAAYSGPLISAPEVRSAGIGLALLRRYWAGPQDLTLTHGATGAMADMWLKLGGISIDLDALEWVKCIRPIRFVLDHALDRMRSPWLKPATRWLARPLERLARRAADPAPKATRTASEDMTAESLVASADHMFGSFRIRPAYDVPFLEWLFQELAVISSRGRLTRRLVRDQAGQPLGWHICLMKAGSTAEVLQVAARPGALVPVLEDLFGYATIEGASAVYGRLEHQLLPPLVRLGFSRRGPTFYRSTSPSLMHSPHSALLRAAQSGAAFLTRLDGEWWMALRTERYSERPGAKRKNPHVEEDPAGMRQTSLR